MLIVALTLVPFVSTLSYILGKKAIEDYRWKQVPKDPFTGLAVIKYHTTDDWD